MAEERWAGYEWQMVSSGLWHFGRKVRGIVRGTIAAVEWGTWPVMGDSYLSMRSGWRWHVESATAGVSKNGCETTLEGAVQMVENALRLGDAT